MITEPATVTRVAGGVAWVRCEAQQACQRCAEGRGCGGGALGRLLGDRLRLVRVASSDMDLRVGEGVVIGLGETALVRAALVMYLVPLLTLFAGAAIVHRLSGGLDPLVVVGGAAGLLVGLVYARRFGVRHGSDRRYHPVVLGRLGEGADDVCPVVPAAAP
jgi:sigma-E factor negative regulatory protein RseC